MNPPNNQQQRPVAAPQYGVAQLADPTYESLLLNDLMESCSRLYDILPLLSEECFTRAGYGQVLQTIRQLAQAGQKVTFDTVYDGLRRSLPEQSAAMVMADIISAGNSAREHPYLDELVRVVVEYAKRRALKVLSGELMALGTSLHEPLVERVSQIAQRLSDIMGGKVGSLTTLAAMFDVIGQQIDDNLNAATRHHGVTCGIRTIDQQYGLPKGLTILGAETSHGKTAMACYMGGQAMWAGAHVAFYSLEMDNLELTSRLLAIHCGVPAQRILYKELQVDEQLRVRQAMEELRQHGAEHFYFDTQMVSTIEQVLFSITAIHSRQHLDMVVVDYLQLLGLSHVEKFSQTQEQQVSSACRQLYLLGRKLGIAIVGLSQLNRAGTGEPDQTRLRESGMMGAVADVIILLWRPLLKDLPYGKPYDDVTTENTCMVKVEKHRGGAIGRQIMGFIPETTKFVEIYGELPKVGMTLPPYLTSPYARQPAAPSQPAGQPPAPPQQLELWET